MFDKVVSKEYFILKYNLETYKTQEICDNAVGTCLPVLKFVPNWFATNKMLEKSDGVVFHNYIIDLDDIDSDIVHYIDLVWVLLLQILIIFNLMIAILRKMILILLPLLDLAIGV